MYNTYVRGGTGGGGGGVETNIHPNDASEYAKVIA